MSVVFKQTKQQLKYQKKFIEKAKSIHGNKYDYSKVVYKNVKTKVKIICLEHGEFHILIGNHINNKQGCSKCINKFSSTEKWIEKAKFVHGNKYDYSKVVYKNAHTKVKIICPIHGEFTQLAYSHLNGRGCKNCGIIKKVFDRSSTTEEFIKRAKLVHGDKYNYSDVIYKNNSIKVTIICPIHGQFEQRPSDHIKGSACPICGTNMMINKLSSTTEEFIKRAKLVHGDKYDYSLVHYKNNRIKIKIICPIHGQFEQVPKDHLMGTGCPVCADIARVECSNYISGKYTPKHPEKYSGDIDGIIYRSSYELKAFEMIEENRNIKSWSSEEVKIQYELNDTNLWYTPDLKIEYYGGKTELIEVKPSIQTKPPEKDNYFWNMEKWEMNQAKWKAAKEYCKKRGWEFEIWTEQELGI